MPLCRCSLHPPPTILVSWQSWSLCELLTLLEWSNALHIMFKLSDAKCPLPLPKARKCTELMHKIPLLGQGTLEWVLGHLRWCRTNELLCKGERVEIAGRSSLLCTRIHTRYISSDAIQEFVLSSLYFLIRVDREAPSVHVLKWKGPSGWSDIYELSVLFNGMARINWQTALGLKLTLHGPRWVGAESTCFNLLRCIEDR